MEKSTTQGVREKIVGLLMTGFPVLLIERTFRWVADRTTTEPWQGIWFLLPLAVVTWGLWQFACGRREFRLRGPYLLFFVAYVSLFSLAAGSNVLDWKRTPVGFEGTGPRNWLALNWAGDWRYWLTSAGPALTDMVVVTRERPATLEASRVELAALINLAASKQARAIALDYDFADPLEERIDDLLCTQIELAKSNGIPVVVAYGFTPAGDRLVRTSPASSLAGCILPEHQGHAVGFREPDGLVRLIPLYFQGRHDWPAFSLRVAERLAGGGQEALPAIPEDGLLQFLQPDRVEIISFEEFGRDPAAQERLRDQLVVVGDLWEGDRFRTPFGELPGVVVQAYAIHALRKGRSVQRTPWWSNVLVILVACYALSAMAAAGASAARLLKTAALMSLAIVAASALTMALWLIWMDVIYALTAIWVLVALLPPCRALLGRRRFRTKPATPASAAASFE